MPAARAVQFTGPRELAVEERSVPDPEPDEVRVRAVVSAVSPGTELLVYRGEAPEGMAADETIPSLAGSLDFPLQYGYAVAGEVSAVGRDVLGDWLGERVFAFHPHESHFVANPDDLYRIPDEIGPEEAVFLPNVETAVNFLLDGTPRIGEQVVVFGQGVVGLLTTRLLADCPLADLVTLDRYPARRDLARELGADHCLDPARAGSVDGGREGDGGDDEGRDGGGSDDEDGNATTSERVRELIDVRGTPEGADLTYELSGNPAALDDAVAVTGYDGRVLVGSWYGEKRADLALGGRYHRSRITIESTQVSTLAPELRGRWDGSRRLDAAWNRLADLDTDRLVTHRIPVEDAPRAYDLLDDHPEEALGVLLTYD